jgi:hypothetical protein
MLCSKRGCNCAGLVHCPSIGYAVHIYRSEWECRQEKGCKVGAACPLAGQFLFDEGCTFAQYLMTSRAPRYLAPDWHQNCTERTGTSRD